MISITKGLSELYGSRDQRSHECYHLVDHNIRDQEIKKAMYCGFHEAAFD